MAYHFISLHIKESGIKLTNVLLYTMQMRNTLTKNSQPNFNWCFVGTKDVITSLILTASFVILASGLFRGRGREGMISKKNNSTPYGSAQSKDVGLFE